MAIAFVASREQNNDTDAISYSITPFSGMTGFAAGHVAVMTVACPTPTTGAVTFTGWTQLWESPGGGAAHKHSVWYRVLDGTETTATAYTFDQPGTATGHCYVCNVYSGTDTSSPIILGNGAYSAVDADNILVTPTVSNPSAVNWAVVGFASSGGTDSSVSWAESGMTIRNDIDGAETTGGSRSASMGDSNAAIGVGSTSSTGTLTETGTADLTAWIGLLQAIAVAPAESPSVTVSANDANVSAVQSSAVTTTAYSSTVPFIPDAGSLTVTVTAYGIVFQSAPAEAPSVTATAYDATMTKASPEEPAVTVTAYDALLTMASAEEPAVTAMAYGATMNIASAGQCTVTATAYDANVAAVESVTVTVTAYDATMTKASPEEPAVTLTAYDTFTGRSSTDTGHAVETIGIIPISSSDTGHAVDTTTVRSATLSSADPVAVIDQVGNRTLDSRDTAAAVDEQALKVIGAPRERTFIVAAEKRLRNIRPAERVLKIPAEVRNLVVRGGWNGRG